MPEKKSWSGIWKVIKQSFSGFSDDKVPKLSASLSYCTIFSFAPLLIVIIYAGSLFFGREAVEGSIYNQIQHLVGKDTALQIQQILKSAAISGNGHTAMIIGIVTLIIGATSIFAEVQDSINTIWGIKAKPHSGIKAMIKNRLLSFGVVGSLGFLLLVSLAVSAMVEGVGNQLRHILPSFSIIVIYIINLLITFGVTTLLFAVIFKVLPDAKITWSDIWVGALVTAFLFNLGKLGIALYISKSKISSSYGTAGALVIMLVWIYYSSIILYYGAEFTKSWAVKYRTGIKPASYAVVVETKEVEQPNATIKA